MTRSGWQLDDWIAAEGIQGGEPDDASKGGFGSPQSVVAEAKKHLGYRETGENDTKFNRWLGAIKGYPHDGFDSHPWCHAFVSYALAHSGGADAGPRTGAPRRRGWFKQRELVRLRAPRRRSRLLRSERRHARRAWSSALGPAPSRRSEGTRRAPSARQFFNGDGVYQKSVQRTSRIFRLRPACSRHAAGGAPAGGGGGAAAAADTAAKPMTTVRLIAQQQEAVNALGFTPKLDVDGEWGPKTETGVKWLQKKIGADVDGEWG